MLTITRDRSDIDISDIDIKEVLRNIGYGTGGKLPARMITLVSDYVEHADHLVDPSYSYVIRDVELVQGAYVVIEGPVIFESKVIAQLLKQCPRVALFITTINDHLEETVSQLAEDGFVLQALVLDAVGSSAVERLADLMQSMIGEAARTEGLCMSQRFSPGYCDWNVSQQKMVFRAMNGDSAGVRLTEEYLMLPMKSISGIIGLRSPDIANDNPCKSCDKRDCVGRR